MHIIKLNAIDSTNVYLKALVSQKSLEDYTIVVAKEQTHGRGQMGSSWHVEKGKNLTCSVFRQMKGHPIDDSFYISMITSLAIIKTLKGINIPKLHVKWPNDILSANFKICGILIENVIRQNKLYESIIGIGLNVNQQKFEELPSASSLKTLTGKNYNHDEIVHLIVEQLKKYTKIVASGNHELIVNEYESNLFRKDKPSTFMDKKGKLFVGFIKGVNTFGKLKVLLENDMLSEFELKEIKLMY